MHLVIIGAGPAGEAAAKAARRLSKDARITLIERARAGGLCLNWGCIPSKTLLESVRHDVEAKRAVDWAAIQTFKTSVVDGIRLSLEASLKTHKIELKTGVARFTGRNALTVTGTGGDETLPFDKAIVCTGTEVYWPSAFEPFKAELWTSDNALSATATPKTLVVVGGGAVGCEFACLFNAAGSRVTVLEMKDQLLPGEDAGIAGALQQSFEARGITVKTATTAAKAQKTAAGWALTLSNGEALEAETVLVCVGRTPNHADMGFETAAVDMDGKRVKLTDGVMTTNPDIFVAGDAGITRLAHAAAAQAEAAAARAFGQPAVFDEGNIPRCLYSWPEVASVGAWKSQLDEKNLPVKTVRGFFKGSAKAIAAREAEGFAQIVFDPGTGRILGAQIIGPHATELIHVFSVALKKAMTVRELGEITFAHPSLSEVLREAARK